MKCILLHGGGLAGDPHQELGGKTLLEAAATPNMDALARQGILGNITMQAGGLVPNSDVVALALLGYDPRKYYPGPAPLEALGLDIVVGEHDVVFRCNMVTLRSQVSREKGPPTDIKKLGPSVVMDDPDAGGLEPDEARELIDTVNEQVGSETIQFYAGSGRRHLMVWVSGKVRAACIDPREIVGRPIGNHLPTGDGSDMLRKLMDASLIILRDHPVNDQRREAGLKPAHCLWLWGQGRAPQLSSLADRYGITGSVVSNSDVHRGIGFCAGLSVAERDGVRPIAGADFEALGESALKQIEKKDLVYLHAQMPSDVAENSDPKAKLKVVEEFDQRIVGRLIEGLRKFNPYRLLLICDRILAHGTPAGTAVTFPCVMAGGPVSKGGEPNGFSESEAASALSPCEMRRN